jgi:outer membrane protein insertion porin family
VPGANADRTLRIFLYADAGNVWGEGEKITLDSIRASVGMGVSWISPVGPLKLSYGTPVHKQPNDRIQRLQFQIGTAF